MAGIDSLFQKVHNKTKGSLSIITFLASMTMFLIGVNLFIEDTHTSYMGLQEYQTHFGLSLAIWPITYWSESLVPQVGQIVFFYIFFSDMRKNWWALVVAFFLLLVDFYADLYHRTQGTLTLGTLSDERTIAGAVITIFYFTIGAELFISIGWGIAMTTFAPAVKMFKKLVVDIAFALGIGGKPKRSSGGRSPGRSGRSQQRQVTTDLNPPGM